MLPEQWCEIQNLDNQTTEKLIKNLETLKLNIENYGEQDRKPIANQLKELQEIMS